MAKPRIVRHNYFAFGCALVVPRQCIGAGTVFLDDLERPVTGCNQNLQNVISIPSRIWLNNCSTYEQIFLVLGGWSPNLLCSLRAGPTSSVRFNMSTIMVLQSEVHPSEVPGMSTAGMSLAS